MPGHFALLLTRVQIESQSRNNISDSLIGEWRTLAYVASTRRAPAIAASVHDQVNPGQNGRHDRTTAIAAGRHRPMKG